MPRKKLPEGSRRRLNTTISTATLEVLDRLAERWKCERSDALERLVRDAWSNENNGEQYAQARSGPTSPVPE